jgi:hypothetical protein
MHFVLDHRDERFFPVTVVHPGADTGELDFCTPCFVIYRKKIDIGG